MAVFIEARTDPFVNGRNSLAANARGRDIGMIRGHAVRRPTRGYQIRPDSYAYMRIMGVDGRFIPVIDAAGELNSNGQNKSTYFSNFFIQSVTEQRAEKQQILETFGDWFIYFFGSSPDTLQVQGFLLNTADFNWRAEFWENYEKYFRGTRLAEMGARLYLIFDDRIIEGYMLNVQATTQVQDVSVVPFSFQLIVTGHTPISLVGSPYFPVMNMPRIEEDSTGNRVNRWLQDNGGLVYDATKNLVSFGQLQGSTIHNSIAAANRGDNEMSGQYLARALQSGFYTEDPSSSVGYANRIKQAIQGLNAPPRPQVPYYGTFRENADEFVTPGIHDLSESSEEILSHSDWHATSQQIDNTVSQNIVPDDQGRTIDTTSNSYSDTMGRNGQALQEMRYAGGDRGQAQANTQGNQLVMPTRNTRTSPFGYNVANGEFAQNPSSSRPSPGVQPLE